MLWRICLWFSSLADCLLNDQFACGSVEVMKGLWAKKYAKMKKNPVDSERKKQNASEEASPAQDCGADARKTESGSLNQASIFCVSFSFMVERILVWY